jgi:hypothetical protein
MYVGYGITIICLHNILSTKVNAFIWVIKNWKSFDFIVFQDTEDIGPQVTILYN